MDARHKDTPPLTPDRLLARRLREHREARGLSLRGMGDLIGYPHSYVSRMETGKQRPSDAVAERLDRELGTSGEFVSLLEMARAHLIEAGAKVILDRETEAVRVESFTSSVIPGLLQTEEYAHGLTRAGIPGAEEEEIRERVGVRMKRQELLTKEKPPVYRAVIDEAALARPVGGHAVMREQLSRLITRQGHPNITVQILPSEAGAHGMMGGSLLLLDLETGPPVALVESFRTGVPIESRWEYVECAEIFQVARQMALPVDESTELIRRYEKEYAE
ncbi:helix-turn-helix domain-containing protein [Streptomyces alkaliphilus]|uniref:helix-turn-helix domain-containing protein n=1 Tax=Streptomyces alkaliphilus TaxID=1472722 RepID=UPI00156592B1|nr:helix-turn-helix transcriptional regulator [Streptomyces alkaliphilus]